MKTKITTKSKKCEIYLTISMTALGKSGTGIGTMDEIIKEYIPGAEKFKSVVIRNRLHVVFRIPVKQQQEAINTLMLMKKRGDDYGSFRDCEVYSTNMGYAALKSNTGE